MKFEIPDNCLSCRFFNMTEDGEMYCCLYDEQWEMDCEDLGDYEGKPKFCTAKTVEWK